MSNKTVIATTKPSDEDVLFAYNHPGNIHYRKMLHAKASDYHRALKRITKDTIAHSICNKSKWKVSNAAE